MVRGFISRVFGVTGGQRDDGPAPTPSSIEAGQVYSFQTRPYSEFGPANTGRFAAIKILGVDDRHVVVAVLDRVWPDAPTGSDIRGISIINEHRFAHTGRPAVFGVNRDWWKPESDLDEFNFAGTLPVSRAEQSHVDAVANYAPGSRLSTLHAANDAAEGEWRWANDRDAFVVEAEKKKAKNEAERAAKEERYRTRLSKLTWAQLRSEIPFERWTPSPPFPPEEFTMAARATIRSACNALEQLGPKPRRTDVRVILKKTVIWFNEADEEAGGVIETEEREDICAVLEEMAHVARQKVLVDEIDEWREW
ncbi:hypothetical protein GGR44_001085 [Sphingobium fontiphilum]|uniref:Uncharacterized protein n=1 Tax=Sphingobium fontiphilum TaxID=944425 RepID=A0A7W6GNL3_9SPHN|nr:hypothetical protein [Sphingobium fontiphilum]MBB3981438.1 hypothetical protein [Sphingobium fontiphilum]